MKLYIVSKKGDRESIIAIKENFTDAEMLAAQTMDNGCPCEVREYDTDEKRIPKGQKLKKMFYASFVLDTLELFNDMVSERPTFLDRNEIYPAHELFKKMIDVIVTLPYKTSKDKAKEIMLEHAKEFKKGKGL